MNRLKSITTRADNKYLVKNGHTPQLQYDEFPDVKDYAEKNIPEDKSHLEVVLNS